MSNIDKVHVIFKTHLDIGFTDYARNVVQAYFTSYIPAALTLARRMREDGKPERFLWTTGSWLIYEYLEQADAPGRRAMEEAILAGDIAWHGLPFTTHTELMDAALFRFGLSLSRELDRRFGKTTIAAKMTDATGHTRSMVPLLAEAGVRFLHIGVNVACHPPAVPPVFTWKHPDGAELVVMYHTSYGGTMSVPGLREAIAFAHTGDNHGPQSADEVRHGYAQLRAQFPGAAVVASTLDAFAQALLPLQSTLPVLTQEIGDTWIHGAASDPWKVAAFRELCRTRTRWLEQGLVDGDSAALKAFSRALLLVPEHTWGLDEKTHLGDYRNYARPDFEAARARDIVDADAIPPEMQYAAGYRSKQRPQRYSTFEASWAEQRDYIHQAVGALHGTAVEPMARAALASLMPQPQAADGFVPVAHPAREQTLRQFRIRFDPATGALTRLTAVNTGRRWADARHPLAQLRYQTFSQADYDRYLKHYTVNLTHERTWTWAIPDLSKPGMAASGAESRWWHPALRSLSVNHGESECRFRAELALPEEAVHRYGAPAEVVIEYTFSEQSPRVGITVKWFGKAANRLPEALWFSFCPRRVTRTGWSLDKMGSPVSPLDVVRYGNRRLHAVGEGVTYAGEDGVLIMRTLDAPLVAPGSPGLLDFSQRQPDLRKGIHVNLYNNIWGTNFPMWYGEEAQFRFVLECSA